jgi:glycosyltransferase involved in cell wall biosynthesis
MLVTRVIARHELGGTQLGLLRLTGALARLGIQTRMLAGEATREAVRLYEQEGIPLEVWGRQEGMQYACSEGFAEWLRPRLIGSDLVHAHMFGGWWAAASAARPGVPLVASEHNALQWPDAPRLAEMREALRRVDAFFAHGPATRAVIRRLRFPPDRIHAGSSPIEVPDRWRPRSHPTTSAAPLVLFAGRLHEEKGPDLLVDAVPRLRSRARCVLLGTGPQAPALRERIEQLGLAETVEMPGWQRNVPTWMGRADLVAIPSRYEAWSQSAVTAMAHGVPVVATNVEALPTTLGGRRGILVPPEDPVALARAIDDVLTGARLPDLTAARRYAERFTADRVADRYARVYRSLARSHAGGRDPSQPATPLQQAA